MKRRDLCPGMRVEYRGREVIVRDLKVPTNPNFIKVYYPLRKMELEVSLSHIKRLRSKDSG
jgi:hypothetical protein